MFRLSMQSSLDISPGQDVLPDDFFSGCVKDHSRAHERLSKPACSLLTSSEIHEFEILWQELHVVEAGH